MPIFVVTYEIQKESNIYISMGTKSKAKKEAKHNSVYSGSTHIGEKVEIIQPMLILLNYRSKHLKRR